DINGVSGRNIRRVPALLMGRTYTSEDAARADLRAYIDGATTTEDLQRLLIVPDGGQLLIDFTNPEAKAWWQESVATVLEVGVDGFKLDRAEEMVSRRRDVTAYDGRTMREIANDYPNLYIDATYEVTNRIHGDDMVLLPRAGFPGAQTQAVFWGGDHYNDWLGLRNALIGAQRASILGYPFWGSDTGGYFQPTYREVTARWLGMSAFHGIYEVGPTSNRAPWDMPTGPRYDAELVATYRLYTKVREAMQPYLQTLARAAHENGHPLVRPLFYHYPEDGTAWEVWDQFLLGPDVLVAPVITEGATEREVYLPSGTWTDAWTGDAIAGPATVTAPAPMHQTPIYLRQGASLTLPDLNALYQESLDLVNNLPPLTDGSEVALPTVE
ncbi:MAG: TIM-barrel domain-containing protein, partial [Bacteroidota bacterium]